MKIKAKAKINLSLNVLGVKNGYHELESLVTEISLADEIKIKKSNKICVKYKNFNVSNQNDNAFKTLKAFYEKTKLGATVIIKKKIPLSSGLGGSSADSVGIINGLKKLYPFVEEKVFYSIIETSGSDCPVQYAGGTNLMRGRGEVIENVKLKNKLFFTVIACEGGVDTAKCFSLYDSGEKKGFIDNNRLIVALNDKKRIKLDNCLKYPAMALNENIEKCEKRLAEFSPMVNMSGSGSAVYAVFYKKSQAKKTVKKLKKEFSNCFYCESVLKNI